MVNLCSDGQVRHFFILVLSINNASAWHCSQENASYDGSLDGKPAVDASYGRRTMQAKQGGWEVDATDQMWLSTTSTDGH